MNGTDEISDRKHFKIMDAIWEILKDSGMIPNPSPVSEGGKYRNATQSIALFVEQIEAETIFRTKEELRKKGQAKNADEMLTEALEMQKRELIEKKAELEAKVHAYEAIISNSNFKMAVTKEKKGRKND